VNTFTEPKIMAYQATAEANAYREVLPAADEFQSLPANEMVKVKQNPETAGIEDIKVGTKAGQPIGWICKVASYGYSSDIKLLVGIGKDAKLGGILVLSQNETPGLGTNVTEKEFIGQSEITNAQPQQDLKVKKDGGMVQAVAGATISSRAVLRGINQAFIFYRGQTNGTKAAGKNSDAITDATKLEQKAKK
ncbi:MAG TPA: RnfABCDGE type electron transport complex subunit G, partial [Bacillota bacterium]|nr:RnfABCDGE type electron transport complex subunit G [Bacillota bacterium]